MVHLSNFITSRQVFCRPLLRVSLPSAYTVANKRKPAGLYIPRSQGCDDLVTSCAHLPVRLNNAVAPMAHWTSRFVLGKHHRLFTFQSTFGSLPVTGQRQRMLIRPCARSPLAYLHRSRRGGISSGTTLIRTNKSSRKRPPWRGAGGSPPLRQISSNSASP